MTMDQTAEKIKQIGSNFKQEIIELWKTKESADFIYFSKGETESWIAVFWKPDSVFVKLFNCLDTKHCAEIACGFGRHSAQIFNRCESLYLIDTSVDATAYAAERFKMHPHVKIILSHDGISMPTIMDNSLTSIFSYDAMVHFEPLTIACYLSEISRTLITGGRALLHHSNFSGNPTGKMSEVTGARNYMPQSLFAHLCSRNGFQILEQHILDWSFPQSDALTLIEKK